VDVAGAQPLAGCQFKVAHLGFGASAQSVHTGAGTDDAHPFHVALQQRVGRLGRPVGDEAHLVGRDIILLHQLVQRLHDPRCNPFGGVVGGRHLHLPDQFIGLFIDGNRISEGAADIYADTHRSHG